MANLKTLNKDVRRAGTMLKAVNEAGFPVIIDANSIKSMRDALVDAVNKLIEREQPAPEPGEQTITLSPESMDQLTNAMVNAISNIEIKAPAAPIAKKEKSKGFSVHSVSVDARGNVQSFEIDRK